MKDSQINFQELSLLYHFEAKDDYKVFKKVKKPLTEEEKEYLTEKAFPSCSNHYARENEKAGAMNSFDDVNDLKQRSYFHLLYCFKSFDAIDAKSKADLLHMFIAFFKKSTQYHILKSNDSSRNKKRVRGDKGSILLPDYAIESIISSTQDEDDEEFISNTELKKELIERLPALFGIVADKKNDVLMDAVNEQVEILPEEIRQLLIAKITGKIVDRTFINRLGKEEKRKKILDSIVPSLLMIEKELGLPSNINLEKYYNPTLILKKAKEESKLRTSQKKDNLKFGEVA